jgi:aminotransferase
MMADLPLMRALSGRAQRFAALPASSRVSRLARNVTDTINLCSAVPDLPPPAQAREATIAALEAGLTRYAPVRGLPALCDAIAAKLQRESGLTYDPEAEILVTGGSQEAHSLVAQALLDPGELLLVPDPRYLGYDLAAMGAGGDTELVPTRPEDDYQPQSEAFEAVITAQTKGLVLCSPHFPTGTVYTAPTLRALAGLAIRRDLIVVSDELYDRLVFDGAEHCSIAGLPGMRERTIVVGGVSKVYAMAGWRIGWLAAPAPFIRAIETMRHGLSICPSPFAQQAAAEALTEGEAWLTATLGEYAWRRELVRSRLAALGLGCPWSRGAFFLFPDVRGLGLDSRRLAERLLREARVLVQAGASFGPAGEGGLMLSILQPRDRLEEALARLLSTIEDLRAQSPRTEAAATA